MRDPMRMSKGEGNDLARCSVRVDPAGNGGGHCARNTPECYGASKAAIIHMTKYFSVHLAKYGIRVNCISPGGVFNHQGADFVENYSQRTPMSRMADEKELSGTAVFLASDGASYITGQNIAVDGGWTAW